MAFVLNFYSRQVCTCTWIETAIQRPAAGYYSGYSQTENCPNCQSKGRPPIPWEEVK